MNLHLRCDACGKTCWAKSYDFMGVDEDDPMEDACEHIKDGGSYTIIDSEYESGDD